MLPKWKEVPARALMSSWELPWAEVGILPETRIIQFTASTDDDFNRSCHYYFTREALFNASVFPDGEAIRMTDIWGTERELTFTENRKTAFFIE